MYLTTGVAEQVQQTRRPLDQCFEIASTLCLHVRSSRIIYTDLCSHERTACGDLRTSKFWVWWPQILGQRCLEYNKTIKILSKTVTGLCGLLFQAIPRWRETVNGCLFPFVQTCSESESCYQVRTKAKISSDVLGLKIASEAIVQHQIQEISWGSIPPDPLSLCVYTQ